MLSILVPTYNYAVDTLILHLSRELENLKTPIEIIVLDDASTDHDVLLKNASVEHLCSYIKLPKNLGRTHARNHLAKAANYENLLFLDADVLPLEENFIATYLKHLGERKITLGGIVYCDKVEKKYSLRWKYGKSREARSLPERKKNPFSSIISMAFLIDKSSFLKLNLTDKNQYGLDTLFSYLIKKNNVEVNHIDNPIIHNGLESNEVYLKKTLEGLRTLSELEKSKKIPTNFRPIQNLGNKINALKLETLFFKSFEVIEKRILQNLRSSNPSLRLFDIFRLYHFLKARDENA